MCGLLASLAPGWDDRTDPIAVALHERGPDAFGVATGDGATFVHTRLSILGLGPEGVQPAKSSNGRQILVFNGEIYNFRELGRAHGMSNAVSDTQVLLEMLTRLDAAEVIAQLRGMYAFAYWNQDTRQLVAVRDPMGIKPLYLHSDDAGLPTLASCLPALVVAGNPLTIDPVGLVEFLASGHTGPVRTIYQQVNKLLPGTLYHWQLQDDGQIEHGSRPVQFLPAPGLPVDEALADSVRAHLVADVEVGAFLSGGIDSTLLSAVATREVGPIKTFTVSFPESPSRDESALAQWNAKLMNSTHQTIPATAQSMTDAAATFMRQHGEPFGDAACLPLTVLAASAAQSLKVVLCGEGADELFGGYSRYRVSEHLRRREAPTGLVANSWGRKRGGAPWARALEAALWGGGFRAHAALLDSDLPLLQRIAPQATGDYLQAAQADWRLLAGDSSHLDAARRYDRERWLPNVYLEKTDRSTMASSLEGRLPYLDKVVAAVAPQPRPDGTLKLPLRNLLHEILPQVRLPDRKKGLAVDIWALRAAGLDRHFRFAVHRPTAVLVRAFGAAATSELACRADRSPSLFFRLAMLGLWEQEFDIERFPIGA